MSDVSCPIARLDNGRILTCFFTNEEHVSQTKGCYQCCDGCFPVWHGDPDMAEVSWPDDDPFAWDATCTPCEGRGTVATQGWPITHAQEPCSPCNGTGVDETIPLQLVGIGSVLRYDGSSTSLRGEWIVVWVWATGAVRVHALVGHGRGCTSVLPDDIGRGCTWQVVRAVPPANLEEMML
jgi:hypothetical protein